MPVDIQRAFLNFEPAWIVGQRLGCLAWSIVDVDAEQEAMHPRYLPDLVTAFSEQVAQLRHLSGERAFMELPISVLEICSTKGLEKRLPAEHVTITQMRNLLAWYRKPGTAKFDDRSGAKIEISKAAPVEAADIIAQMILFSDLPAVSLVHALSFFIDSGFEDFNGNPEMMNRLQAFLNNARSTAYYTRDIAAAVHSYTPMFRLKNARIDHGAIIRNSLLDALLAWPLLVFKRTRAHVREASLSSFSFPVVVDLDFDGNNQVAVKFGNATSKPSHELQAELERQMEKAFLTAKELWRSKNGHVRERWDEVKHASCTVDLRLAAQVCRDTPVRPIWQDNSAQAYFVQVFLAKLIGRQVSMTAGVSGTIEETLPEMKRREFADASLRDFSILNQDSGLTEKFIEARKAMRNDRSSAFEATGHASRDRRIGKIDGQKAKYRFARASKKYRKLILPRTSKIVGAYDVDGGYIEVNYVHSLGVAADVAQLGGWRQHNYCRCPDVGHLIHRDPDLLPPVDHPLVLQTANALGKSGEKLVRLDDGHSVLSVAALLSHLNFEYRFKLNKPATSLSWSVLRAIPGETESRFWHTLLKTLGASDLAIREHFLRNDANYTAGLIRSILNGDVEAQRLGCLAAPDIVVVFEASHLWRAGLSTIDRKELQFDAGTMIEAINKLPIDGLRAPYREKIGAGRIIFLDSGAKYMNAPYFNLLAPPDTFRNAVFAALSVFDHGFTLQMARNATGDLAENIAHLKSILDDFVENGFLWRHGEHYFLPHALRAKAPSPSLEMAKLYKRIANSLMPGIGEIATSGFATAECFEADKSREAQSYLAKAVNIIDEAVALSENKSEAGELDALKRTINCELDLQRRFFEMPTWGVLTKLNKNPNPAFRNQNLQYADYLLDQARQTGRLTPQSYTSYVRAAENALFAAWSEKNLTFAERLIVTIDQCFIEAERLAESYSDPVERNDWLVHVLTWQRRHRGEFFKFNKGLLAQRFPRPVAGEVAKLDRRVLEICNGDSVYGVFPDIFWFIRQGDSLDDDHAANELYQKALFFSSELLETYPRLFGSMSRTEYGNLMKSEPGEPFWKGKVAESAKWVARNRTHLDRRPISRAGKERIAKGYLEMQRYLSR